MHDYDLENAESLVLRMKHGLGDTIQTQVLVRHLKHYYPHLRIGVEARPGRQSCLIGVADEVHSLVHPWTWLDDYQHHIKLDWCRSNGCWENVPATKPTQCLFDEFQLEPIEKFYYYEMHPTAESQEKAARFIKEELANRPYGILHYRGCTNPLQKDLTNWEAYCLCAGMVCNGLVALVLDWGPAPHLAADDIVHPGNGHWLWQGYKNGGDAGVVFELIRQAELAFFVDSGPAHLAGATDTLSYVFYPDHWNVHPVHVIEPCKNLTHLIPVYHRRFLQGNADFGEAYFGEHYNHLTYQGELTDMIEGIAAEFCEEELNSLDHENSSEV